MTDFEDLLVKRAEMWLGRPLVAEDGIAQSRLDAVAIMLGREFPAELAAVYRYVGEVPALMRGFEIFVPPEECELDEGNWMFLVENQEVCAWGVATDGSVVMQTDDGFFPEGATLGEFLMVVLPYQLAQGGWDHAGERVVDASLWRTETARIAQKLGWEQLADHNGLVIFGSGQKLAWALQPIEGADTASVFLTAANAREFANLIATNGFEEL